MKRIVAVLFWITFTSSCASSSTILTPPAFEYRSYEICEDLNGLCYPVRKYGKCLDKFLWMCKKRQEVLEVEVIPFNDNVGMKKFKDAGFVLMRHPMN